MIVYLCGPINGRPDHECVNWRQAAAQLWPGECLDPMRRDYRGREMSNIKGLIADDLADIARADGLLVYFDRPSVGTSMEIYHAKTTRKLPIVVVDSHGNGAMNPWLVHHVDALVPTLEEAVELLWGMVCSRER
jgi:hypothetical protein